MKKEKLTNNSVKGLNDVIDFLNKQELKIKRHMEENNIPDNTMLESYMRGAIQTASYIYQCANEKTIEGKRLGYEFDILDGWYKVVDEEKIYEIPVSPYVKF